LKTVAVAAVARDGRGQQRRVWDAMLESQQLGASAVRSPFWADAITFLG